MKLALQFIDHNPYPRCGIFIKHASPKVWLQEVKRMKLQLSDCTAYACPSMEANGISGVLLILKTAQKNIDIGNNITIQKVHENFFIPENTALNMALTDEEFTKLVNGSPHFFHHEFGMIELNEVLNWATIIQNPQEQFPTIETPAKGVKIPTQVASFSIEIEEVEEVEALENPFGSEEVDPKDLPFDMKKVLEGNNAEVAKYLNYLDKNPDAALKMAIPLDMMGTSRGKAFAKYKFKSGFFESLGFGKTDGKVINYLKIVFAVLAIVVLFWIGYEALNAVKETRYKKEVVNPYEDIEPTPDTETTYTKDEDTDTDVDLSDTRQREEQLEPTPESSIIQTILAIIAILALLLFIRYLLLYGKQKEQKKPLEKKHSWLDLPDESELFDIHDDESEDKNQRKSAFYFGGNEISAKNKIFLTIIIIGLLVYLFYPILNKDGFPGTFGVIAAFIVLRMLYTLLNRNKKFDQDDA
ncbi:hypothetical protein [Kordia sp.]|uniref:hypothetical protein n=1 Tax=Kordia sp. TaxID=1965332 RepID=UPI003D2D7DE6